MFAGLLGMAGGSGGISGGTATSGDISSPFTNNAAFVVGGSGRASAAPDSGAGVSGGNQTGIIVAVVAGVAIIGAVLLFRK